MSTTGYATHVKADRRHHRGRKMKLGACYMILKLEKKKKYQNMHKCNLLCIVGQSHQSFGLPRLLLNAVLCEFQIN